MEILVAIGVVVLLLYLYGSYKRKKFEQQMSSSQDNYYEPPDWQERRAYVLQRDGHRCVLCESTHSLHVHHVVHRTVKYDHSVHNLLTLCHKCHGAEHGRKFVDNETLINQKENARLCRKAKKGVPIRARTTHTCDTCGWNFPAGAHYVRVKTKELVPMGASTHYYVATVCERCYGPAR